jgi:transcriptional regulator with XRE-family HTH domain
VFPGFDGMQDDVAGVVRHLAEVRRTRGLSQMDVAERMATSQSAIARLESGRGDVRMSTLQRYADALGHTLRFAVAPADQPQEDT